MTMNIYLGCTVSKTSSRQNGKRPECNHAASRKLLWYNIKIFQHGFDPMNLGISGKTVAVTPYIDPNSFHAGTQCANNIGIGIVAYEDAGFIGHIQKLGCVVKDTAVGLMDTHFTGKNYGIKQRSESQDIDLVMLESKSVGSHITDNGCFDAKLPQLLHNGYLLNTHNRMFVDVVKIVFLAITKAEVLVGRKYFKQRLERGLVNHGIPDKMGNHKVGSCFNIGIVLTFIQVRAEHAGVGASGGLNAAVEGIVQIPEDGFYFGRIKHGLSSFYESQRGDAQAASPRVLTIFRNR